MRIRHTRYCYALALLVVFCVSACTKAQGGAAIKEQKTAAQTPVSTSTDHPTSGSTISDKKSSGYWNIVFVISGGFAGIQRQLKLDCTGQSTATDLRHEKTVEQKISREQMTKIANALADIDFPKIQSGRPNNCRDCLEYTIILSRAGQYYKLNFNDESLRGTPCAGLASLLSTTLNQALAKPKSRNCRGTV